MSEKKYTAEFFVSARQLEAEIPEGGADPRGLVRIASRVGDYDNAVWALIATLSDRGLGEFYRRIIAELDDRLKLLALETAAKCRTDWQGLGALRHSRAWEVYEELAYQMDDGVEDMDAYDMDAYAIEVVYLLIKLHDEGFGL